MQDAFIISTEKLPINKDPTRAIYTLMIIKKMTKKNRITIQANKTTNQLTEEIITLITQSTGWIIDQKTQKNIQPQNHKNPIRITEYQLRRTPAIEIREE